MPTVLVIPCDNAGKLHYSIEKIEEGRIHVLSDPYGRVLYDTRDKAEVACKALEDDEDQFLRNRYVYYTEMVSAYSLKPIGRFQGATA